MTAPGGIDSPVPDRPPAEWLEAAVRALPVGVVVADRAERRVRFANAALGRMLGAELAEGRPLESERPAYRVTGEPYTLHDLPLARALDRGESVADELVVWRDDDGTETFLAVSAAPIRDGGRVVAAVAMFEDVTGRERRDRAERDFVANAAHELQTPLAAITSSVEVLQAGAKEIPEDRDRFLAHVQAETHRLARLAHALLLLARLETGAAQLRLERVPLRALLDETALAVQPAAGVEVRVRCPARLAATTDRSLLEQALINVAGNAAKFTDAGSIVLAARRDGDGVVVEVADTGVGPPTVDERDLFARFSRGAVHDRAGFGLGLFIARQAVVALGGRVELAARRPRGTVVRISLPRHA